MSQDKAAAALKALAELAAIYAAAVARLLQVWMADVQKVQQLQRVSSDGQRYKTSLLAQAARTSSLKQQQVTSQLQLCRHHVMLVLDQSADGCDACGTAA